MENTSVNETNNGANGTSSNNNVEIDYGRFEEILNKKINQNQRSMFKSFLQEEYGLEDEQIKDEMESYKSRKKQEEARKIKELEDLKTNYANIQNELNQERLNNAINLSLMSRNLNKEQIPYISKMIDTNNVLVDGKVDSTKLEESIESLFKTFPEFLKKEEKKSFVQVGTSNNSSQYDESSDALLRKAFGLKEK